MHKIIHRGSPFLAVSSPVAWRPLPALLTVILFFGKQSPSSITVVTQKKVSEYEICVYNPVSARPCTVRSVYKQRSTWNNVQNVHKINAKGIRM
jgi:hypothetical protein